MVARMGRLRSTDPAWTLKLRNAMPMKAPSELAPTAADMPNILLSIRHALEALAVLAERDRVDITVASQTHKILEVAPTTTASKYAPAAAPAVQPLLSTYREIIGHTNAALSYLDQATLDTATPLHRPHFTAAISTLDRRRDPATIAAMFDSALDADPGRTSDQHSTAATTPRSLSGSSQRTSRRP
ncbi:hypothetical protein [Planotetraspora sp. GP83]|uniref:hypothetical protein n=1 Tax=Planotetraspora sp. GP83 TaxID=3156264 RepID=UPI00351255EF